MMKKELDMNRIKEELRMKELACNKYEELLKK
jgi:hypothetical protein